MKQTFNDIRGQYEDTLDGWLLDTQRPTNVQLAEALAQLPYSTERAALLSLTYNNIIGFNGNGSVKSPALRNAILTGDRAEAWYQIRYYSNGNHLLGIARRRYEESQIFGLFNNPSNPSLSGAVQVYQMLTAHRAQIEVYDKTYGSAIPTKYGLAGHAYGNITIPPVQTLIQAFQTAEIALMKAVDTEYKSLLSGFTPTNSADIYLNPGRSGECDDASNRAHDQYAPRDQYARCRGLESAHQGCCRGNAGFPERRPRQRHPSLQRPHWRARGGRVGSHQYLCHSPTLHSPRSLSHRGRHPS